MPALVLMTDDTRGVDWPQAAAALPRGAAVIVRHREPKAREALARRLKPVCAMRGTLLLIADDLRLAVRVRADGVHIPQRHGATIAAIRARFPRWLVTASAHGAASVIAARAAGADCVLIAPVFATASHPGRGALGPVRFAALAGGPNCYALGGIDARTVRRLAATPACGIALIGGWVG